MSTGHAAGAHEALAPQEVWIDGCAAREVSVLERALHYGDGLFETIACLGGSARFLELHLARLARGAERLGIAPLDPSVLRREVVAIAARADRAVVKVLVSRGVAAARGYAVTGAEKATRITFRFAWPPDDPSLGRAGVRVRVAALRLGENPHLAGLKHCNRLEQIVARRESSDPDFADALLFSSSGALISGTMSNVFIARNGELCTPRLDRCGVAGIMRQVVREVAARAGMAIAEAILGAEDLARAQELFLTNALIGIRPVREIDGRALAIGPLTRRAQQLLAPALVAAGAAAEVSANG